MSDIEERLAHLGFRRINPSPILQPYVDCYWYMRREASQQKVHEEYMHPLGGFGIVFNFGDVVSLNQQLLDEPIFLDGANSQSRRMGFHAGVKLLGVRFREGMAYPFLGIPLVEINNQTAILDFMGEDSLMPLYVRLAKLGLPAQIAEIEAWLIERLRLGQSPDRLIASSLKIIQHGISSMDALSSSLNIGQRQLERLYQQHVGLSPKAYSRLLRIEAARKRLKLVPQSLTDLGLSLGYYDQSHFIREFKAVVGITPSAYIKHSLSKNSK